MSRIIGEASLPRLFTKKKLTANPSISVCSARTPLPKFVYEGGGRYLVSEDAEGDVVAIDFRTIRIGYQRRSGDAYISRMTDYHY